MKANKKLEKEVDFVNGIKGYFCITVGVFLMTASVNVFFYSHNLVFGGVAGIAIILKSLFDVPLAVTNFVINTPLFLIGAKFVGKGFFIKSVYATIVVSLFLEITKYIYVFETDMMIASIFGAIALGAGMGLIIKCNASTGGVDMFGVVINRLVNRLPIPKVIFLANLTIVVLGAVFNGINNALHAVISIFFISKSVEVVMKKLDDTNLLD